MAVQPTEILLVSASGEDLVRAINTPAYNVQVMDDTGQAMEALRDAHYDLILLDDGLFNNEIVSVIKEIKRRVPLVPVLVLSENSESEYQTDLMEAGADDFLNAELSSVELQRRLRLMLRQRRQARALAQRNQNLQTITLLARRMHSATDPHPLIADTIDTACKIFQLYGMAIVLGDTDTDGFQLYAGSEGSMSEESIYESIVYLKDYDPFRRVIRSGMVQVFQNIVADTHYLPIPVLPSPESAIILPLNYQEHKFGAMAVFGTARHPLGHDDLLIYELFASQFTVALHNARHYHSQRVSGQSSQIQLRAWQRLVNLHTYDEIAEALRELMEEIPNIPKALVWMYGPDLSGDNIVVKSESEDAQRAFHSIQESGQLDDLLRQLDERRMQPISLQTPSNSKDPLSPLFKALRGTQLVLVPIMDSARFIGGVIASVVNNRQYSSADAKLLATSLAHAAGLAMERTLLIQNMIEKSGQLEALLRSTSQGIVFVDNTGLVAFCNPQFTELTGIVPSAVLNQPSETALQLIADQTHSPDQVIEQLEEAVQKVLNPDPEVHDDYPIVEIRLGDPARAIHVEFTIIGDGENENSGWAAIVRDTARFQRNFSNQSILLDIISDRIRVPYAQIRGLIATLNEQHSRFTHRERARFLHQIEDNVDRLGHLWDNFLEIYNLEVSGVALSYEEVDLYEIVQRVIDGRSFAEYRRQIQVEAPARLPLVQLDEIRMEQAFANILHNAARFSPKGAPISVRIEQQGGEVWITVRDQGAGIPGDQLEKIFEPLSPDSTLTDEDGVGLGLFLAREVVQRHGGKLWLDSAPGRGTAVVMALPIVFSGEVKLVSTPVQEPITAVVPAPRRSESTSVPDRSGDGRRVSERPMQTIMVVEGYSKLVSRLREKMSTQGYELIPYRLGEEAVRDVNTIRLDLIFVDVNLSDANGLDICERICKRTEVPIIMLADEPSEAEKVRALMIGADDYISEPISDEELVARVNVIFKRRRIPDRTREPLDLGTLFVDFARREVFLNDKPLELTRIEYDLLHTLAVNQGQVLTHKQLLEKVWGPEYQAETQYLWVNVSRLRKKLEPTADSPRFIHTQPGVGYVFRPS